VLRDRSLRRVNEQLPSVTILIAARPDQADIKAVTGSRSLDYPREKLDIIVARGKQPSVQRNAGMREARGDVIYFLDDDSVPQPDNLRLAVGHFRDEKVKMVGGPNLCPADAPALEKIFAVVLASALAFGPSRARYASVGEVRDTSEKELILCNMMARRDALLESGGFDEKLYPNEENALMDELQKRGGRLVYDPKLIVHRRPRHSIAAFARMLRTYGRGRAEQFRSASLLCVLVGDASGLDRRACNRKAPLHASGLVWSGSNRAGDSLDEDNTGYPLAGSYPVRGDDTYSLWLWILARPVHEARNARTNLRASEAREGWAVSMGWALWLVKRENPLEPGSRR
jgi:glycosyltransferase involved in cell wall biosynthesis